MYINLSQSSCKSTFAFLVLMTSVMLTACGGGGSGSGGDSIQGGTAPPSTSPQFVPVQTPDAVRFLEQASFGPTDELITKVQSSGFNAFIDEQIAMPISGYPVMPFFPASQPSNCNNICARDNYSLFQVQLRFFQNALNGPDQLRQRVAFALSQIFVVSGLEVPLAYAGSNYQQLLTQGAFGNFRQLLYDVTLSPAMGRFLNMADNNKPAGGSEPNENYAREVLQLFSIGVNRLNPDGSEQLDGQGRTIPTYTQETIEGFAHVFTGWTYPTLPNATPQFRNPQYYTGPMIAFQNNHDTASKTLLNGVVLPAGQTAEVDLSRAIDNIFLHPNVGPFIGKQLIQHLVTSNPSPAYVSRVTSVFNNNGSGVRGDLRAVVKAILLDTEARGNVKLDPAYGHLREPALLITGVLRALSATSDGVFPRSQGASMGQNVFNPPSVFNYFPPDYIAPGSTILGPEFAIQNTATTLNRANFMNTLLFSSGIAPDVTVVNATGTSVNLAAFQAVAADPAQLVEKFNTLLLHGTLSDTARNAIITAVSAVPASDTLVRARTAAYLVAVSSQYQVER